jgi:ABC-type sulfate/molybdate transport systems ATPase subunit
VAPLELDITVALRAFALDLGLSVGRETLAIAGPSGAGKSTLLRAVAGLVRPDRGRIALGGTSWYDGRAGLHLPPERRAVGLVFQDYALFPHLTVRQNVAFGGAARADELLARLRIDALADERPAALSGGERQRVALARALARAPAVLLLDEPLAALDAATRAHVRGELHDLLAELALPTLLVTHDHRDAAALADRIGVLVDGRLRQLAAAEELVRAPADAFVARFCGVNVLPDRGRGAPVAVPPWALRIVTAPPLPGQPAVAGTIAGIEAEGPRARVRLGDLTAEVPAAQGAALARGQAAWAVYDPADAHPLRGDGKDRAPAASCQT